LTGIHVANLKQEDQSEIARLQEQEKRNVVFAPEPFLIKACEPLPEIFIQDKTKPWEVSKKRNKLKGYQKGKKR